MTFYSMTMVSRNKKTGPIPVVTASRDTCPTDCPLLNNGCYADHGPLRLVWDRVTRGEGPSFTFERLLAAVKGLPRGQLWRYGQAGDLPATKEQVVDLAKASQGRKVIAYTHKRDFDVYRTIQKYGFYVNLSASNLDEADQLSKTGLPVVVVLSSEYERRKDETLKDFRQRIGGSLSFSTQDGNRVAICPATYLDTNCSLCQVCSKPRVGGTIIGFPAHGTKKKQIDAAHPDRSMAPWLKAQTCKSSSTPLLQ